MYGMHKEEWYMIIYIYIYIYIYIVLSIYIYIHSHTQTYDDTGISKIHVDICVMSIKIHQWHSVYLKLVERFKLEKCFDLV